LPRSAVVRFGGGFALFRLCRLVMLIAILLFIPMVMV
jgi:hypothetical protein